MELTAALTAMGEIQTEQMLLLRELVAKPRPWTTSVQTADLLGEAKAIRRLLEQAGKKIERRFSLPKFRLPRPSFAWLIIPAVLLGLLAMCYGWAALSNGLEALIR